MNRRNIFKLGIGIILAGIGSSFAKPSVVKNEVVKERRRGFRNLNQSQDIKALLDPTTIENVFSDHTLKQKKFLKGIQRILKVLIQAYWQDAR